MVKKTIAFKLTIGIVIIALISMLTIGLIFINMFRQYTFESHQKNMLSKANSISEAFSQFSQTNSAIRGFGSLVRFLDTIAEAKVWITDSEGNPIELSGMGMAKKWTFDNEPLPSESQDVINEVLKGRESVSKSFSSVYNEATLTVGVPILNSSNHVIGSVLLHAPVTGITGTLNKSIYILTISLITAIILSACLGVLYSLMFTKPLKKMNQTALEMANGNYSARTGITADDEIGQLGESLDILANKLGLTIDQLFQEKGKLADIISSISEGIIAFDLNYSPITINQACSEILHNGLSYEADKTFSDIMALGIATELKGVINGEENIHTIKEWKGKKLQINFSPIKSNTGVIIGAVALIQDISERERLEQLRRDFVANVSHEFRTPLTVIRGSLEAILDGAVTEKEDINRYNEIMASQVRGLERLVGDLLDLSRLQSGNISLKREKININELLSDAVKSIYSLAEKKAMKINHQNSFDIPPIIGDYDRLRQLVLIFLDNSVKYSPEKTTISIKVDLSDTLNITIKDQGYGIAEDEIPFIWQRFYKTDKARNSSGTGLGLAIAKQLADLHGASLSLQSELGKGTSIKISLQYTVLE